MTLEDLGNIGEFVAALGVIISLVYLATQIRQNTRAVRSSASQAITDARADFLKSISDDPEVAGMFFTGLSDRDALDPVERYRFDSMLNRLSATMENYHYQNRQGAMDPEQWTRMRVVLRLLLSTPGGQAWWSSRRRTNASWVKAASGLADLSFDRFVDQEIEQLKSSPPVDSQDAV